MTVLRFTPDGTALLSGSEDSGVSVWSVSRSILAALPVQSVESPDAISHFRQIA